MTRDEALALIDNLKHADDRGEYWKLSDLFASIGYSGARQMNTEVARAISLGARQGVMAATDFINTPVPTGGRPRMEWRMSRRGLYLFIQTCNARTEGMNALKACVAVLALG